ncbi:MAG: alpha/beta fold hydrolase [Acidobacteria bacterium]|nr:alpha/beta fold hydrolase [Acidobacteriota bacterium]
MRSIRILIVGLLLLGSMTGSRASVQVMVDAPANVRRDEVRFTSGEVTIAGTLTLPPGQGRWPAVVMVGAVASPRKSPLFSPLAAHLAGQGIAVLCYDSRGAGDSTGQPFEATIEELARDVSAAMAFLRQRADIRPRDIGLCSHSQGAWTAQLAAAAEGAAFLVMLAGPSVPMEQVDLSQIEALGRAEGLSPAEIRESLDLQRKWLDAVRRQAPAAEQEPILRRQIELRFAGLSAEIRAAYRAQLDDAVAAELDKSNGPWFQHLVQFDPAPVLARLTCPVLAVYGDLDHNVVEKVNKPALLSATHDGTRPPVTIHTFTGASHYFLPAETGTRTEMFMAVRAGADFVSGFLDYITGWIQGVTAGR